MGLRQIAWMGVLVALLACPAWADIINGSFETGDFTGWVIDDWMGSASVIDGGTDGIKAARLKPEGRLVSSDDGPVFVHGFVFVGQELVVPADACYILFDAWVEGNVIGYSDLVDPNLPEVTITSFSPTTYSLNVWSWRGEEVLFGVVARDTALGDNCVYFDNARFTNIPELPTHSMLLLSAIAAGLVRLASDRRLRVVSSQI